MTKYSMQITVPHSVYDACTYFIPKEIGDWLHSYNLKYGYVGGGSWGNGFTNGVTNQTSNYMVYNIQQGDALAFRIQFPHCKVYQSEQVEYS
jgi:hypothetical protein